MKYQVASLIDLYVNLPVKCIDLFEGFYDENIIEMMADT